MLRKENLRNRRQDEVVTYRVYCTLAPLDVQIKRECIYLRQMYGSDLHCNLYVCGPQVDQVVKRLRRNGVPVGVRIHKQPEGRHGPTGVRGTYAEILIRYADDRDIWCGPLTAEEIYDQLVDLCGASNAPWPRAHFVSVVRHYQEDKDPHRGPLEYRFQGILGFGGKLYHSNSQGWRVGCYVEDDNPERRAAIDLMNEWLHGRA